MRVSQCVQHVFKLLQGEFIKAVELFTKCIELFPDRVVPYTNRALCYLRLNEVQQSYILPDSYFVFN